MTRLLGLGVLVQIAACGVVGVRLLGLARRTRQAPELAFGAAFVLFGVVGYPLSIGTRAGLGGDGAAASWLLFAALASQDLASLGVYLGTWRVFRPRSGWAPGLVAAAAAAFAASLAGQAWETGFAPGQSGGAAYYLGLGARFGAFAWAAVESLRYADLLQRRLRLGLADAAIATRFRLWSVANCTLCAGFAVFLWGQLATPNPAESAPVLAATSVVGVVGGVSMWLAFFPPRSRARRAEARASQP